MKILLVEDSYIERHKVGGYLADWGLDYQAVGSGTEAVKLLEGAEPPNMALLDWMLPGLDGIDVCRRIRKLGTRVPYIYTVMLTAKNRKQDLLLAMEAGADDYLAKPVDPSGSNHGGQENSGTAAVLDFRRHSRFSDQSSESRGNTGDFRQRVLAKRTRREAGHADHG
jgi:CheY-like chemotaxis protein